jgi:glucosamine--fructose-6-phosphate aminotransferase (isomerizing)
METDLNSDHPILEGAYFRDIQDQPRALRETWEALGNQPVPEGLARRLRQGDFARVVLTGMGSSYHVLHPLNLELVDAGLSPIMMETSELIHYGQRFLEPATLLVAVSQSGRSIETLRLLELNRGRASLIGVTNTPGSPLAERADALVLTHAGEESTVSCKTYTATLMALRWLAEGLCSRGVGPVLAELAAASAVVKAYLEEWPSHVAQFRADLGGVRHLFVVGRGASLGAVGTGPLTIKESDRFHAEGMSSAAFRHGPMEMLNPEMFVLVYGGDARTRPLNERLFRELQAQGAKAVLCAAGSECEPARLPEVPESLRPILEILPVQMITLALAALEGREAGRFERATKITSVE